MHRDSSRARDGPSPGVDCDRWHGRAGSARSRRGFSTRRLRVGFPQRSCVTCNSWSVPASFPYYPYIDLIREGGFSPEAELVDEKTVGLRRDRMGLPLAVAEPDVHIRRIIKN